jgi:hypothetical protein
MLEKEIKAAIEANLPAQVGDVLKEKLLQADRDAANVRTITEELYKLRGDLNDRDAKLSEYSKFDARNDELDKREEDLGLKVRLSVINELNYKLEAEKDKTTFVKELAMGLVRNTEYRRELFDSQSKPVNVDQYGNQHYANSTQNSTETIINK